MKDKLQYLGLVVILLCTLNSCISKKEIAQPLPREIVTINDHYYNDNLNALIKDYTSYPQYKEYIYELIFIDFDFSAMSYEDIFFIKEKNAYNSELYAGFKEVLKEREYEIVDQLQYMPIDSLHIYYMKHPVQRSFIGEFIDTTIIRVLPDLEYPEIKYLANLFKGTQVGEKMRKIQDEQKAKKTTIVNDLDNYALAEISSLDSLKKEIEIYAMQSAFAKLESFMGEMLKDDFPKKEKDITMKVNNLIQKSMSREVEKFVNRRVTEYISQINETRRYIYSSFSEDSIKVVSTLNECIFMKRDSVALPKYRIKYNPQPLFEISKKQNKRDWIGGVLTISSFIIPFIPYVNITAPFVIPILDGADIAWGVGNSIKTQVDIKNQNQIFLDDFVKSIQKSSSSYSEAIKNEIRSKMLYSQDVFKKECYEIY